VPSLRRARVGASLKRLRPVGTVLAIGMVSVGLTAPTTAYASTRGLAPSGNSLHGNVAIEWGVATAPANKDPFTAWMLQSIKDFESANPGVKFNVSDSVLPGNAYLAKIQSQMAAGTTPDIFEGWTEQRLIPFAKADRLLNLRPYFLTTPAVARQFSSGMLSQVSYKGGVYGVPLAANTEVLFYNKAIFAKYGLTPPTTWTEFSKVISVLKGHGVAPIALDTESSSWEGSIIFTQVAERLGGMPLFNDVVLKRSAHFDNPSYVKTGEVLQALVKAGAFNSDFASESDPYAQTLFESGKAAMWDMGDWDVAALWPAMHNNLGWFPFPSIPGGKGNGAEVGNIFNTNTALSLSPTDSPQTKAVAWDFIKYLLSSQRQAAYIHAGLLPATNQPLTPAQTVAVAASVHNAAASSTQQMSAWDDALGTALGENFDDATAAILGGQSPASALAEVDQYAKQLG
jgi:raffinose/stachyose/melibiose transport system substrate-binding protein